MIRRYSWLICTRSIYAYRKQAVPIEFSTDRKHSYAAKFTVSMQSPATRHFVVVFDIDGTLCKSNICGDAGRKFAKENFTECPVVQWRYEDHIFLPHLDILFDYLLKHDVRIVFFSSAIEERNTSVIPELLTSFWGTKKYETLKSEGQFAIFSENHLIKGRRHSGEGNYVKDLNVVIRDGESLSDVILVEDDNSFPAHDQQPYLYIMDLQYKWYMCERRELMWDKDPFNFSMNSTYYMLGIFKTYFNLENFNELPLREGLKQILPTDWKNYYSSFIEHPFARKIIDIGLVEVQKQVPNAVLYGQS